jgi:hypothetical protein
MRKRLIEFLILWLLPGYHLHRDPIKRVKPPEVQG